MQNHLETPTHQRRDRFLSLYIYMENQGNRSSPSQQGDANSAQPHVLHRTPSVLLQELADVLNDKSIRTIDVYSKKLSLLLSTFNNCEFSSNVTELDLSTRRRRWRTYSPSVHSVGMPAARRNSVTHMERNGTELELPRGRDPFPISQLRDSHMKERDGGGSTRRRRRRSSGTQSVIPNERVSALHLLLCKHNLGVFKC